MEVVVEWNSLAYNGIYNGVSVMDRLTGVEVQDRNKAEPIQTREQLPQSPVSSVVPEPFDLSLLKDEELVREVARGSEPALEALYDRHVRGCFGLAMKIVRDPSVAEEVVQDIFLKVWSSPQSFSPDRGKFSGWLLTLVHNRSVDKLRRNKASSNGTLVSLEAESPGGLTVSEVLPDDRPSPYDEAWQGERSELVHQLVGLLPEAQRQAIHMAYFEGLTQKEIAERLHEPLGTIKTRTRSALQHLRRLQESQELMVELR